jgi:hypothetical protein
MNAGIFTCHAARIWPMMLASLVKNAPVDRLQAAVSWPSARQKRQRARMTFMITKRFFLA